MDTDYGRARSDYRPTFGIEVLTCTSAFRQPKLNFRRSDDLPRDRIDLNPISLSHVKQESLTAVFTSGAAASTWIRVGLSNYLICI